MSVAQLLEKENKNLKEKKTTKNKLLIVQRCEYIKSLHRVQFSCKLMSLPQDAKILSTSKI